ncbi:ParB/RepB/Spo0J family partition protein [Eisenibacter elegans]|uniref:ParB/RepB/Spo0J family partition protein n=1 Tax=Eisenibacter elegans TaxID=997 RepID=UPI00047D83ED|nr:ParB N-terminal domain-containing protein [Eisenibacter elegans]
MSTLITPPTSPSIPLESQEPTPVVRIKAAEISLLSVGQIVPHPDNRPLGANEDKIAQLKILITNDGFDSSHPLVVRPLPDSEQYQIIEGEHRYHAACALGFTDLPCVIRDVDDTEALIQLVLGNTQSETKPIEIGLNALKVVQKDSKRGYSAAAYAQRLGMAESTVRRYLNAAEVFQYLRELRPEEPPMDEVYKLEEIHRAAKEDWAWFHDMVIKQSLNKTQVIEISQAIRDIKTDSIIIQELFDLQAMRQQVAQAVLQSDNRLAGEFMELLEQFKKNYDNLDDHLTLYEYNVLQDNIEEEEINLKEWFVASLKELKSIDKQSVMEAYKDALQMKRTGTREEAERTAEYFRDKKNAEERVEQERIERQMRQVKLGEWWQLGRHWLYCGDASSPVFQKRLPAQAAFAFVNPPYQTEIDEQNPAPYDWTLDWLAQRARIVAVTPALHEVQRLLQTTEMPYRWSMACWITAKNPTKAQADAETWIYTAVFSQETGIQRKTKDAWRIEIKSSHNPSLLAEHRGSRPYDFMEYLVAAFSGDAEVVIDAYAGAGTTLMVAEDTGRTCYAAEINPDYCKDIVEQWEKATGHQAQRFQGS